MKFEEFNLDENLLRAISEAGFTDCLPVQEMSFEHSLAGKDVAVQSQTGSGKTAAFLIPILQRMALDKSADAQSNRALVIAPTRELAVQIEVEAKALSKYMGIITACFYGGVGYANQEKLIKQGARILIGTPGRLIDMSDSKKINFMEFKYLVIDEADRLFDMGFLPDIKKMLKRMPSSDIRHSMIFSATLTDKVRDIASQFMNNPVEIELTPENMTVDTIAQSLYHVARNEKINLLLGILKKDKPANAIIFTNTKYEAVEVANRLEYNGYHCEYIIGDLPQTKRQEVINNIKSGKIKYLVATDVAARGLHVDDLELVVNYDLPEYCENYVHRIGRTARTGKSGKAISFACEKFVYGLEPIETFIKMKIPVEWADDENYQEDASKGVRFQRHDGKTSSRGNKDGRVPRKEVTRPEKFRKEKVQRKSVPAGRKPEEFFDIKSEAKPEKKREVRDQVKKPEKHFKAEKFDSGKALDDRLEYYRKKYGDNFTLKDTPPAKKVPFFRRIINMISRSK
jgi:ATP-dependent RNA helicase RhlB